MDRYNNIKEKSFVFALRCIKLNRYLRDEKKEFVISKQILRSGTSIGANIKEGLFAQSKPDFLTKLSIAKKEAAETEYWLELLDASEILSDKEADSMLADCRELLKILVTICKKTGHREFNTKKSDQRLVTGD